jgi:two-component system, cell cycle sensor histidine kinase and response regulator CckA
MPDEARNAAELEWYLRSLFDTMFEGIQLVDADWRYVYVNETAARHGRRSRNELIGRTMMEVYPGIEETEMFGLLERCRAEGTAQRMLNRFEYADGTAGWFDLRINAVEAGTLILSVDVTAQKRVEGELRRSREDLATTLDCMVDGVVATDMEGRVTRINPAAESLIGWSAAEAGGRPVAELVCFLDGRTGAPVDHPVDAVLEGGLRIGLSDQVVLVARDGRRVPAAASGAPIRNEDGSVRGVVLVLRDMTEEDQLTSMLRHSQKMEAVGRLAGGVAHDFNNILSVITSYTDLVLGNMPEDAGFRRELAEIRRAAERAASLTRQLLSFSRKRVVQPEVLDVNETVEQMGSMLRRLVGAEVELVTRLDEDLAPIRFDPGQIEQILMNLAVNARDAMPDGGTLTLQTANVELDEEYARTHPEAAPGPHVMIAAADTGVGMDRATQDRIFEPFFTTKPRGQGTGLGLATIYGIVKQGGGNVWVYSEPGQGTTFKVYLPRATDDVSTVQRPDAPARARTGGHETVLVVEDDPAVRDVIRKVLEVGGYTVLDAGDSEAALASARDHDGPIHVLLADIMLPGGNGRDLAASVRTERPDIRVLFMSGYTDETVARGGVLEPGTRLIEKPFAADTLLRRVREALGPG